MESILTASDKKNRVDNVEILANSEKINCLNNCPPAALQLELILSQGYLSAYDACSVRLVSHFFRELFFSYALKPDHLKNLPVKPRYLEEIAFNYLPIFLATQVSQFMGQPDGLWTAQEKFEQFPLQCIKDEFLPFNTISLNELKRLKLDGILIKHHLAIKKCTFAYLLENSPIIEEQLNLSKYNDGKFREPIRDFLLVGLLKDVKRAGFLTVSSCTSLSLKYIQQKLVDGKITMREALNAVKNDDDTLLALDAWNGSPEFESLYFKQFPREQWDGEFQKQLTFEQVIQYPRQARTLMSYRCLREIIFKEEQKSFENGQKMRNDFLKLRPDSLEMRLLELSLYPFTDYAKLLDKLQELLEIHGQGNKEPDRDVFPICAHSRSIWTNKLVPIADMITVEKLIKLEDLVFLLPEKLMILAEEPLRSGLKSGALTVMDLHRLSADEIMGKLDPNPDECTIQ